MTALTVDEFKKALPNTVRKSVNQALIDAVNKTFSDPDMFETYRDNLMSYTTVMNDGRFKVTSYIAAVKYVSFKVMGMTNIEAYSRTFPDKIKRFTDDNVKSKDIASYVTAYNKSKLVNLIMEQTLVPTWVLNQDLHQKAINTLAELMTTANSEKVRSDSATSLLTHLKVPEAAKVQLDINVQEDSSISELRKATLELAAHQRQAIQSGAMTAGQVAEGPIIKDVECEVVK